MAIQNRHHAPQQNANSSTNEFKTDIHSSHYFNQHCNMIIFKLLFELTVYNYVMFGKCKFMLYKTYRKISCRHQ